MTRRERKPVGPLRFAVLDTLVPLGGALGVLLAAGVTGPQVGAAGGVGFALALYRISTCVGGGE